MLFIFLNKATVMFFLKGVFNQGHLQQEKIQRLFFNMRLLYALHKLSNYCGKTTTSR